MTKGGISHAETRSKIGHHRVQGEKFERTSLFLCLLGYGVPDRRAEVVQSVAVWQSCLWSAIIAVAIFCL